MFSVGGFGSSMVTEGIKDLIKGFDSVLNNKKIDWGKWGTEKLVSYGCTLLLSGFGILD